MVDNIEFAASFADVESQMERVIRATTTLVDGPLDNLIERLVRTADTSQSVSDSFDRLASDILTVFTQQIVDGIFDAFGQGGASGAAGSGLFENILSGVFSNASGLGQDSRSDFSTVPAPVNVIVNNNANVSTSVSERTDARGQREIEIMIDSLVANSLAQGSQTRSVLQGVFGLSNLLRSR